MMRRMRRVSCAHFLLFRPVFHHIHTHTTRTHTRAITIPNLEAKYQVRACTVSIDLQKYPVWVCVCACVHKTMTSLSFCRFGE